MELCLYCDSPLDGSVEHLLLSAIGGKKKSRKVLCSTCNNGLGSSIDQVLAEQMKLFSNVLAIKTGRGKDAPMLKGLSLSTGERLDLLPGGIPRSRDVKVTRTTVDGREQVSIRVPAHRKEVIGEVLRGILAETGKSPANLKNPEARLESVFMDEPVQVTCELGGKECFRAVGKMALNLLAATIRTDAVRARGFDAIRAFVRDESTPDEGLVNHDYRNEFPDLPRNKVKAGWRHFIAVSANQATGLVAGFVELYGGLRFSALLADSWRSESMTIAYLVDPVTGDDEEVRGFPPAAATRSELLEHALDKTGILDAVNRLSQLAWKRMETSYNKRIVEESFAQVFADVAEGEIITEEHISRLASLVANRFARARQRQSSSSPMDPAEILGKDWQRKRTNPYRIACANPSPFTAHLHHHTAAAIAPRPWPLSRSGRRGCISR
jgi:hypothetical protein